MKKILALFIALIATVSFTACEKEPVIGYQPEIPQEWIDEAEKEKNNPYTELVRTADFDGIWQNEATGEYYHFYSGHVFLLDKLDAGVDEYQLWGTAVAVQTVEKEIAANYDIEAENEIKADDVFTMYFNPAYTSTTDGTTNLIGENRTKTVTAEGKEYIFKLVREVDEWPEGYWD